MTEIPLLLPWQPCGNTQTFFYQLCSFPCRRIPIHPNGEFLKFCSAATSAYFQLEKPLDYQNVQLFFFFFFFFSSFSLVLFGFQPFLLFQICSLYFNKITMEVNGKIFKSSSKPPTFGSCQAAWSCFWGSVFGESPECRGWVAVFPTYRPQLQA